jgi:ABC-type transporter Mla subunit MlaD
MQRKQLRATLQELSDALTQAGSIDDQTRELLQSVTGQLQQLLQQEKKLSPEDVRPVDRDLKELLLRFETEHPQLTSILGRIADGLANVGI